jgi:hypothetical protein
MQASVLGFSSLSWGSNQSLTLKHKLHLVKDCSDVVFGKPNLPQACNIGKFFAAVLKHHYRSVES